MKIFKDFCHIDQNAKLSLRRIVSSLDISGYLAAPSLVRYATDFLEYLANLPSHSLAKISLDSHSHCAQALFFVKNTLLPECEKTIPRPEKWLSSKKSVLKWAAPLLTTLPSTTTENLSILLYILSHLAHTHTKRKKMDFGRASSFSPAAGLVTEKLLVGRGAGS